MSVFTFSFKHIAILISFLICVPTNIYASKIKGRADCCIGDCPDDDNGNQSPTLDGPTTDKSPGIGVEFETAFIRFENQNCDKKNTEDSKGKMVGDRQGKNWKLTADTTIEGRGLLIAEYILDGTQIRIGSGAAAEAASAVGSDVISWDPSSDIPDNKVSVEDSTCNPWTVVLPKKRGGADRMTWAPQVTAPLPLEAISDLFSKSLSGPSSALLPTQNPGVNMVYVTKDFFQSKPNGISSDNVKADVLGFFSLVVSYAKAARVFDEDESPKGLISIMPRTDFTNIFNQVKPAIPGTLYDIIKILACYKNIVDGVEIDSKFCTGTVDNPQPNDQMDHQKFEVFSSDDDSASCTVQEWIQSIADGNSPDRLSKIDEVIDGQVGGLKGRMEFVLGTEREVPLFEFRRLAKLKAGDMKTRVEEFEQAVIDYHNAHGNPPRFRRRRRDSRYTDIKRRDSCPAATSSINSQQTSSPASETTSAVPTSTPPSETTTAIPTSTPPSETTTAIPTSTPSLQAQLTCTGVDTTKWMGRDALNSIIPDFCNDAEKQGTQDKDSASLVRNYNNGGDAVALSIDWPVGSSFKPNIHDCIGYMTTVMDSCGGNDPDHNPMNWKHGGYNQVGDVRYNVFPTAERYKSGICSIHVHEKESWIGVDSPGFERTHSFHFDVQAKDADGNVIGGTAKGHAFGAGNKLPYVLSAYYTTMTMTPESQGGDYIQFTIGDQSWTTHDEGDGVSKCHVGDWDSKTSPKARDMDCAFLC